MNNLHRELAPVSASAWKEIEDEARRTFAEHNAGRRVVDMPEPGGPALSAVGTGHQREIEAPGRGITARQREVLPLIEVRVPFTVTRDAVDDVDRGSGDSDWQPVKDAAKTIAWAEDRAVFEGYAAAGIGGMRAEASNAAVPLPADAREYPNMVGRALTELRLAGVSGPYALLLGADEYTAVTETSDHGYPIHRHLDALVDGEIIWAPAVTGGFLISTRGGDWELQLGQDLSIGYASHDAATVELYLQESLTFRVLTTEAIVPLERAGA